MSLGDLKVIGPQSTPKVRVGASATRYQPGEPLHSLVAYTTGTADVNVFVLAAADTPVIGSHSLGGVALTRCKPLVTGTVVAHYATVARPVADSGFIRGRTEVAASLDTESELLAILLDLTLIDYSATGAGDGGELYTIKEADSGADTSGLTIMAGNVVKGTLDVQVDPRAYRSDVS